MLKAIQYLNKDPDASYSFEITRAATLFTLLLTPLTSTANPYEIGFAGGTALLVQTPD